MALFDWTEDFPLSAHPEFIAELVNDLGMIPTKVEFDRPGGKANRRTIRKPEKLIETIAPFADSQSFELCDPIGGNYLNLRCDMQYSVRRTQRSYSVALPPEQLPLPKLIAHVGLYCRHLVPRYGFSLVWPGAVASFFMAGMADLSLSYEDRRRADDWGRSFGASPIGAHLTGKLHDVYELNVLSPPHLERIVEGRPFASWIKTGNRGELIEVHPRVSVWLVPPEKRPKIRSILFNEGHLIATV
jgi:hypothetical protein